MRIKIGNKWFESKIDQPIMVEFTPKDKVNVARMHPEATCYAEFADDDPISKDEDKMYAWMNEGAETK